MLAMGVLGIGKSKMLQQGGLTVAGRGKNGKAAVGLNLMALAQEVPPFLSVFIADALHHGP